MKQNKAKQKSENKTLNIITITLSVVAILLSMYAIWGVWDVAESDNFNGTRVMQIHQHSSENRAAINRLVECHVNPDICESINWDEPYNGVRDAAEYRNLKD